MATITRGFATFLVGIISISAIAGKTSGQPIQGIGNSEVLDIYTKFCLIDKPVFTGKQAASIAYRSLPQLLRRYYTKDPSGSYFKLDSQQDAYLIVQSPTEFEKREFGEDVYTHVCAVAIRKASLSYMIAELLKRKVVPVPANPIKADEEDTVLFIAENLEYEVKVRVLSQVFPADSNDVGSERWAVAQVSSYTPEKVEKLKKIQQRLAIKLGSAKKRGQK